MCAQIVAGQTTSCSSAISADEITVAQITQTCPAPFPAQTLEGAGNSRPLARRSRTVWRRADCGIDDPWRSAAWTEPSQSPGSRRSRAPTSEAEVRAGSVCTHESRKARMTGSYVGFVDECWVANLAMDAEKAKP